jgi:hypothetical protein
MEYEEISELIRSSVKEGCAIGESHGFNMAILKVRSLLIESMKNDSPFVLGAMDHLHKQVLELKLR